MTDNTNESQDGKNTELEDGVSEQENKGQDGDVSESSKDGSAEQDKTQALEEKKARTATGEINSAQVRIDSGEITKEEAPQWMQNDLRPKKEEATKETLKDEVKAELKDDAEFERLQQALPEEFDEEELNKLVASEIEQGRTKSQALKYAMYLQNIQLPQEKTQEQKIVEAHTFPRIVPRKTKAKKDSLVKTSTDQQYADMIEQQTGEKIN